MMNDMGQHKLQPHHKPTLLWPFLLAWSAQGLDEVEGGYRDWFGPDQTRDQSQETADQGWYNSNLDNCPHCIKYILTSRFNKLNQPDAELCLSDLKHLSWPSGGLWYSGT